MARIGDLPEDHAAECLAAVMAAQGGRGAPVQRRDEIALDLPFDHL
jgi:hypothetical protein